MDSKLDAQISQLGHRLLPEALRILREAIRLPEDSVDRAPGEGGDPACGLSNHEGPRLDYLRRELLELGAVDGPDDVGYDDFGNLWWQVEDPDDGVAQEEKVVVWLDGHTDTVAALRDRWHDVTGGGLDPYRGLVDAGRLDRGRLRRELGHLPADDEWEHLLWGRGSADQLGGVVCQILATRILRELRSEGTLAGVVVRSYATVAEEDNDGGGPMWVLRHDLPRRGAAAIPDVVILTEPTGNGTGGPLGIYRGQRGRMQIEVRVTGRSCHGSMPGEGLNPLELGGAILAEAAAQHARGEGFADDPFLGRGSRTASWARLETPSDCAVPERFTFRFDRRLTAGEDPRQAVADLDGLPAVARAREAGLEVRIGVPTYDEPSWRGVRPGNEQIYPGWVTPEEHPAIAAAAATYHAVVSPGAGPGSPLSPEPRIGRWIFSTDGVGIPLPRDFRLQVPDRKGWVATSSFHHPAMFGIGPGYEENTHKVGECVDTREIPAVIAFLARYPSRLRETLRRDR